MGCGSSKLHDASDVHVEQAQRTSASSAASHQPTKHTLEQSKASRSSIKRTTSFSLPRGAHGEEEDSEIESLFPKSPSMRNLGTGEGHARRQSIAESIGHLIDTETGLLSRSASRTMSQVSNCHLEADKDQNGTVLLADEETGQSIKIIKQIGKGGFGRVFLGEYEGVGQVAIKAVFGERALGVDGESEGSQEGAEENRERMVQMEALLMSLLSGHPNIVHTYKCLASWRDSGVTGRIQTDGIMSTIQYEWFMIVEYCGKGSLWAVLTSGALNKEVTLEQKKSAIWESSLGLVSWDSWAALEVLKEVARAMLYLHDNKIIHGDLKAANILLSDSVRDRRGYEAKVTDFGFSRILAKSHTTKTYGTVTHQPPELLSEGVLSQSADVFAFGILMWEVYVADGVFKDLSDSEVIVKVTRDGIRPVFPPGCPGRYQALAERLWAEKAEDRLLMSEVEAELDEIQLTLNPRGQDSPPLVVPGELPPLIRRAVMSKNLGK